LTVKHKSLLIVLFFISFSGFSDAQLNTLKEQPARKRSISVFPILMYDSDIGFGFGGKGIVKNNFQKNESFDLILFGSTKGEQWYVFTFSIPDFEIRQNTRYPLAFDLRLEYDKFLKSNFFGIGNDSEDNEWQFPKEFTKLELTLGRAFSEQIIAEIGLFYDFTSVYGYEDVNPMLSEDVPGTGENLTSYLTARWRWDTRDSQINPHKGWRLGFNSDFASRTFGGDYAFNRYRLEIGRYQRLFSYSHILAVRFWLQHVQGTTPYYEQSIIGGSGTARGLKADRFIDLAFTLVSIEYRFPLYKKLGGVLFTDTGRVYPHIRHLNFRNWKPSVGAGLRYYLENFVVRFDIGNSLEGTRIFFNFGQVF
jgi:outer membrane protein insertion porin family